MNVWSWIGVGIIIVGGIFIYVMLNWKVIKATWNDPENEHKNPLQIGQDMVNKKKRGL
jgi:hypothetical protein